MSASKAMTSVGCLRQVKPMHRLWRIVALPGRLDPRLLPELLDHRAGEIPDEAHAVGARHHLVEGLQHGVPRRVAVHVLADQVRRLNVQHQPGDQTERPQTDRQCLQIGVRAVDGQQRAVGGHQVDGGHGRGQDPVAVAGTMGAGRGRAGHRDVGREPVLCSAYP